MIQRWLHAARPFAAREVSGPFVGLPPATHVVWLTERCPFDFDLDGRHYRAWRVVPEPRPARIDLTLSELGIAGEGCISFVRMDAIAERTGRRFDAYLAEHEGALPSPPKAASMRPP